MFASRTPHLRPAVAIGSAAARCGIRRRYFKDAQLSVRASVVRRSLSALIRQNREALDAQTGPEGEHQPGQLVAVRKNLVEHEQHGA